jgi:hypothetical protein
MAIRLGIAIAAPSELVAEFLAAMGFEPQLEQHRAGQILRHPGRFAAIVNARSLVFQVLDPASEHHEAVKTIC